MNLTKYAIKIVCHKNTEAHVQEDQVMWVGNEDGYMTAWSSLDQHVNIYDTQREANVDVRYFRRHPHPWWVRPKSLEIVEMVPVYKISEWKEKS